MLEDDIVDSYNNLIDTEFIKHGEHFDLPE